MKHRNKFTFEDVIIVGISAAFVLKIASLITRPRVINNYYIQK